MAVWTCGRCGHRNGSALQRCDECRDPRGGDDREERPAAIARVDESPLGPQALLVSYVSIDDGIGAIGVLFPAAVAAEASARVAAGWELRSLSLYGLRAGGTAGSFLSQGGGNYTTVLGATAYFVRTPRPPSAGGSDDIYHPV